MEYSQYDYEGFDVFQESIDASLDGHDDGSGPREILLPPLDINDFRGLLDISQILTFLDFSWDENEEYGMGRHVHYRPISNNAYESYYNFLYNYMFKTKNNTLILSLMPFLTPNTKIIENKIHVKFRDSLTNWSHYIDHATDNHYAYISINLSNDNKPTTIEFRHNESHPFEAYAFIYLVHHLLNNNDLSFKIESIKEDSGYTTTTIDNNYKFTDVCWDELEVPIETFKYVIKKIMEKIPDDPKNNKIKYHVWQVYQNILKDNRIFKNDDIYKYYNYYKYNNKIKDLVEDIINYNVSVKLKVTEAKMRQEITLYATSILIESPKAKKTVEVKNSFYLNDYVKVEPSPSKKSTKTIDVTI